MKTNVVISESNIAFGTSGARGLVSDFTAEVCMAFTHAFISVLRESSSIKQLALGIDNRPSSYAMAKACAAALIDNDIEPIFYGVLPTPALAYKARKDNMAAIMVTGSHIPFDRNGLKFYRAEGEITKLDEKNILKTSVEFSPAALPNELKVNDSAATYYLERYLELFEDKILSGKKIGVYEHSSAGRDLYPLLFTQLGAEVICLDRSDEFVPIDTEAVSEEDKQKAVKWSNQYQLDAIFSTDGDGDRPLVADEHGHWLRGDILGLLCAQELGIEAVAVPVSCNSIISLSNKFQKVELTKIGSPYVIEAFDSLSRQFNKIAGFEANGGFLLGSDVNYNGRELTSLPTRDAVLPIIMLLAAAWNTKISTLVSQLPGRYTYSDRIQNFPGSISKKLVQDAINEPAEFLNIIGLKSSAVVRVDNTDGARLFLSDGSIVHIRPSGNAPELRCYAEAADEVSAEKIVRVVLGNIFNLK